MGSHSRATVAIAILTLPILACQGPAPSPSSTPAAGPSGTIVVSGANPKAAVTRYGQNYWCWSNYGDYVAGTEGLVSALRLGILRAGGHNNDTNTSDGFYPFDERQIDAYVAYSRAVGAEPILQVPLLRNASGGSATARDAADMVRYCNRTRGFGVRYWEIGNEPDLYSDQGDVPGYDVERFAGDFNAFSAAMKRVDPSIRILGPELSWKYFPQSGVNDWLTPFLTRCRGSFDIVAVHRYPFDAQDSTIANAMADVASFNTVVQGVRGQMDASGYAGVPLAITEANISWDGTPANSTQSASPQTFYAGLWLADTLGAALQQRLWAMCFWSLSESWTLGFIDTARKPQPTYYAFQMVASHTGPTLLDATPPAGFSVYASRSAANDATQLIVANKNATLNREDIVLSDLPAAGGASRSYDFPAYSLTALSIPDDAGPMLIWSYTKAMADTGGPPQQLQ
jgi:glycosyl hydrolase family 39 (putative alpha-L-iduronidase)